MAVNATSSWRDKNCSSSSRSESSLVWANRQGLAHSLLNSSRWETAVLAWVVLLFVTMCHEFAHGLTCKHYGGEVHEVGFLLIFFMPCFYCNVSDAWLFKEESKRLWVTLVPTFAFCVRCRCFGHLHRLGTRRDQAQRSKQGKIL
jgi:hypothetical protein